MSIYPEISSEQSVANLTFIESAHELSDEFWQECFPHPLEGSWWYKALENSQLNDQFKFLYGVIELNGKPVGLLPTFLMDVPMEIMAPDAVVPLIPLLKKIAPVICYQRILFVGSPCADEGTVGLMPGIELQSIVKSLHEQLVKKTLDLKASMLIWKDFTQSTKSALDSLSNSHRLCRGLAYPGTMIKLNKASMEDYYGSLKGSRRHNLLKKLKRSRSSLPLETSVVQNPDEQTINEIFSLFWQTYEHGKTKFERLNKLFFANIAKEKVSWWVLLRNPADGKLVAFMLCFLLGDRVINKFIGLDYTIAKDNYLYFRLWNAAMEWMTSIGIKEMQSGQTGYRFKLDVGNSLVPMYNYFWHKSPIIHWIYSQFTKNTPWSELDEELKLYLKAHPEHDHPNK